MKDLSWDIHHMLVPNDKASRSTWQYTCKAMDRRDMHVQLLNNYGDVLSIACIRRMEKDKNEHA